MPFVLRWASETERDQMVTGTCTPDFNARARWGGEACAWKGSSGTEAHLLHVLAAACGTCCSSVPSCPGRHSHPLPVLVSGASTIWAPGQRPGRPPPHLSTPHSPCVPSVSQSLVGGGCTVDSPALLLPSHMALGQVTLTGFHFFSINEVNTPLCRIGELNDNSGTEQQARPKGSSWVW